MGGDEAAVSVARRCEHAQAEWRARARPGASTPVRGSASARLGHGWARGSSQHYASTIKLYNENSVR